MVGGQGEHGASGKAKAFQLAATSCTTSAEVVDAHQGELELISVVVVACAETAPTPAIQELLKNTPEGHPERLDLEKACESFDKSALSDPSPLASRLICPLPQSAASSMNA